jgi:hypothetical protein
MRYGRRLAQKNGGSREKQKKEEVTRGKKKTVLRYLDLD